MLCMQSWLHELTSYAPSNLSLASTSGGLMNVWPSYLFANSQKRLSIISKRQQRCVHIMICIAVILHEDAYTGPASSKWKNQDPEEDTQPRDRLQVYHMQDRVQTLKLRDGSPASLLVFYSCTEESVAYIGPAEVDSDHSCCYNSKSAQCAAYHPFSRL